MKIRKRFVPTMLICILAACASLTQGQDKSELLSRSLTDNEAYIWYLRNSGWAIRTRNHFLIFDYVGTSAPSASPSISNGQINPNEISAQRVIVFVTHQHQDHYSSQIFAWEKTVKHIDYVLGWPVERQGNYTVMNPRESKTVNGAEILTVKSTDLGVGFLVKVDGLTIFHAGDHAMWHTLFKKPYEDEINYIAAVAPTVDLAFVPVTTGFRANCKPSDSVTEGALYAIEKLKPKAAFPMHVICDGMLHVYGEFAEVANKRKLGSNVIVAEASGNAFHYKAGIVNRIK
jgi:L-ascorbate metabolism protein UlaG (beta-lactamase superfamily)